MVLIVTETFGVKVNISNYYIDKTHILAVFKKGCETVYYVYEILEDCNNLSFYIDSVNNLGVQLPAGKWSLSIYQQDSSINIDPVNSAYIAKFALLVVNKDKCATYPANTNQFINYYKGVFANEAAIIAAYPAAILGEFVYNEETEGFWCWNGAAWVDATQGGGGGDADTLNGQPGSYYLDRINHTGVQSQSTITGLVSDLLVIFADITANTSSISNLSLQTAYSQGIGGRILTDATRQAVKVQRGSGADTDSVFEIQNGAGSVTAFFTANGILSMLNQVSPIISVAARGRIAFNTAGARFEKSENGGAYMNISDEIEKVLTDAASIAWDYNVSGSNVRVSLTANRNLASITNAINTGFKIAIYAGASTRTISFNSDYKDHETGLPLASVNIAANKGITVWIDRSNGVLRCNVIINS